MSKLFSCGQFTHYLPKCSYRDEMLEKKGIKKKMMDFDYCEEYSRSISNKILSWQCKEKEIFIRLTFED